jgi:tetratricopeptide (TPR) repeat protein
MIRPKQLPGFLLILAACLALPPQLRGQEPPAEQTDQQPPPPPPGREALDEGWQAIRFADWTTAARQMARARDQGDRSIRAEAIYALGYIAQYHPQEPDDQRARQLYKQVVDEFAKTPSAPWAHLALARMEDLPPFESDQRIDRAREIYRQVIEAYPDHPVADEAVLRLAYTWLNNVGDTEAQQRGLDMLDKWLKNHPDNYLASAMYLAIGQTKVDAGQYRSAVNALIAADETDARGKRIFGTRTLSQTVRSNLYWQIGRIAEARLQDYELAREYYLKIGDQIGRDSKAWVAARRARNLAEASDEGGRQ